jgi:hypothetical protein
MAASCLPNSEHWSIVVDYCSLLVEVIGFGDFIASASRSSALSSKWWQPWLITRLKRYVLKRYGQGEEFWTSLREHEGVISGSTIALVAWGCDLLPSSDRQSPHHLEPDLDVYVPQAHSLAFRKEFKKSNPHAYATRVWIRSHLYGSGIDRHVLDPYENVGRDDLASVCTFLITQRHHIAPPEAEIVVKEDDITEVEQKYLFYSQKLQIIGLERKDIPERFTSNPDEGKRFTAQRAVARPKIANQTDIIRWIDEEFDFRFLANTFDGQQLTIVAMHELVTKTGPNRWLLHKQCQFAVTQLRRGMTVEMALKPLNNVAAQSLARNVKYMALGCTISNISEMTAGLSADAILPNALPRWITVADCHTFFAWNNRFRAWLDLMLSAGIRLVADSENTIEIVSESDTEKLFKGTPISFFCTKCLSEGLVSSPWNTIRDGRYSMPVGYYFNKRARARMIPEFIKRFRQSPEKGVCELHFSKPQSDSKNPC